jgi:hypothetical protein
MLADRLGWATFIGTPKGHTEFAQDDRGGDVLAEHDVRNGSSTRLVIPAFMMPKTEIAVFACRRVGSIPGAGASSAVRSSRGHAARGSRTWLCAGRLAPVGRPRTGAASRSSWRG